MTLGMAAQLTTVQQLLGSASSDLGFPPQVLFQAIYGICRFRPGEGTIRDIETVALGVGNYPDVLSSGFHTLV